MGHTSLRCTWRHQFTRQRDEKVKQPFFVPVLKKKMCLHDLKFYLTLKD